MDHRRWALRHRVPMLMSMPLNRHGGPSSNRSRAPRLSSDASAGAQAVPDADPTLSFPVEAGPLTEPAPEPRPEVVVEQEQDVPASTSPPRHPASPLR